MLRKSQAPAYGIRRGAHRLRPFLETRFKGGVKRLVALDGAARVLVRTRDDSVLVDVDLIGGRPTVRRAGLPTRTDMRFAPDGRAVGIHRTTAIGKGPTKLSFFGANGNVEGEAFVPDAASEIAIGAEARYVGCRDGLLFCFDPTGRERWAWRAPSSDDCPWRQYADPYPKHVLAYESSAVVASAGTIYRVGGNGETLWSAALQNRRKTRWEIPLPAPERAADPALYRALGLADDATPQQVKSAHRRLAFATHPDRNPGDDAAAERFLVVQSAYERIVRASAAPVRRSIVVAVQTFGPHATFLAKTRRGAGLVVGSSHGAIHVFTAAGRLRRARALARGSVCGATVGDGRIGAAYCDGRLLFADSIEVVDCAAESAWPAGMTMFGDTIVVWRDNKVDILDRRGELAWGAEFSSKVRGVASRGGVLLCAAGSMFAFRR